MQFQTPIAMMVFNRPELTAKVFSAVATLRPARLLVVADGPRPGREGEAELCEATRAIATKVDWPCELSTNFAEVNLGCRKRVSSGIDWVFQQVDRAIILEDDCLPDQSFFTFCEQLLEKYRDEPRIMHITGDNFQSPRWKCPSSYYFSRYPAIWGWATWKRAWELYDVDMVRWPELKARGWLGEYFQNPKEAEIWERNFDSVFSGECDTWDHQWSFACFTNHGLAATPSVNLVRNLGFGPDATHTKENSKLANLAIGSIGPLRHPEVIKPYTAEDDYVFRRVISVGTPSRMQKLIKFPRRAVGAVLRRLGIKRTKLPKVVR